MLQEYHIRAANIEKDERLTILEEKIESLMHKK